MRPPCYPRATPVLSSSHTQRWDRGQKLGARMILAVDVPQTVGGDVGIDFGRADAGMAEQLLNDAQVRAVIEQMGGKAVAQHVGGDVAGDAGPAGAVFDGQPQSAGGAWGGALGGKDVC